MVAGSRCADFDGVRLWQETRSLSEKSCIFFWGTRITRIFSFAMFPNPCLSVKIRVQISFSDRLLETQ